MAEDLVPLEQLGTEGVRLDEADAVALTKSSAFALFSNRVCPFAHRAWWALHEKGASGDCTFVHVDLGEAKPAWYKDSINPRGTVPCIYDGGKPVFESTICVEWVEDKYSTRGPALLPKEPALRATVRLFVADLKVETLYKYLMNQDREKDGECRQACEAMLRSVEAAYAAQQGGPFFLGAAPCAADCALLPFCHRFEVLLKEYRNWDMRAFLAAEAPRVHAAMRAAEQRPAFQATMLEPGFIIDCYGGYATGKPGVARMVPRRV